MDMDKKFLVLALLLMLSSLVFAAGTNSLTSFKVGWDATNSQLQINSTCTATTMLDVTLSNGSNRQFTCSPVDIGQTWFIGDQTGNSSLNAVGIIGGPCTTCYRTATINFSSSVAQEQGFPMIWIFIGIFLVLAIIVIFALIWLKDFLSGIHQQQ